MPPGASGSGIVNLYTKSADKKRYYKDERARKPDRSSPVVEPIPPATMAICNRKTARHCKPRASTTTAQRLASIVINRTPVESALRLALVWWLHFCKQWLDDLQYQRGQHNSHVHIESRLQGCRWNPGSSLGTAWLYRELAPAPTIIAGQTFTVVQAGSTYVPCDKIYTLISNGLDYRPELRRTPLATSWLPTIVRIPS